MRALLANETVTFDGEFVHLDGVELDYVHQERRPKQVPIVIGATGLQMMKLAGEIGDGALLNYLVSPAYNEGALAALAEGAARVGPHARRRRPAAARRVLDGRGPRRRARRRPAAGDAVPGPAAAHHEGVRGARGAARRDRQGAHVAGDPRGRRHRRAKLVPDEVVQLITASGTPDECRAKVAEYVATGCTCPVLYPLGDDVGAMIDAFAVRRDEGEPCPEGGTATESTRSEETDGLRGVPAPAARRSSCTATSRARCGPRPSSTSPASTTSRCRPTDVDKIYDYATIYEFLEIFRLVNSTVIDRDDFARVAYESLEDGVELGNLKYREMFFNPTLHTTRGVPMATIVDGLDRRHPRRRGRLRRALLASSPTSTGRTRWRWRCR